MEKSLRATKEHFESSCSRTPEYRAWHRLFKREFKKFLTTTGATEIDIGSPNHFDISGFFRMADGQAYWFRIEDLRWSKDRMLVRQAKDFKDYTGGFNQYARLDTVEHFIKDLDAITGTVLDGINAGIATYLEREAV